MSPEPAPFGPIRRTWIDHTFVVEASPDDVFALLADVDHWPEWVPGLHRLRRFGAGGTRFALLLSIPGWPAAWVPCQLYALRPGLIEWGGGGLGSVIRHRFEVRELHPGRTAVRHVELATNGLALLLLPFERAFHAYDRRWSQALVDHFA